MEEFREGHMSAGRGRNGGKQRIGRARSAVLTGLLVLGLVSCGKSGVDSAAPEKQSLIHLSDRVSEAVVKSAAAPEATQQELSWEFAPSNSDWHAVSSDDLRFLAEIELA